MQEKITEKEFIVILESFLFDCEDESNVDYVFYDNNNIELEDKECYM